MTEIRRDEVEHTRLDDPDGVLAQQYLPDDLLGARYYTPTRHGFEERRSRRVAAAARTP